MDVQLWEIIKKKKPTGSFKKKKKKMFFFLSLFPQVFSAEEPELVSQPSGCVP